MTEEHIEIAEQQIFEAQARFSSLMAEEQIEIAAEQIFETQARVLFGPRCRSNVCPRCLRDLFHVSNESPTQCAPNGCNVWFCSLVCMRKHRLERHRRGSAGLESDLVQFCTVENGDDVAPAPIEGIEADDEVGSSPRAPPSSQIVDDEVYIPESNIPAFQHPSSFDGLAFGDIREPVHGAFTTAFSHSVGVETMVFTPAKVARRDATSAAATWTSQDDEAKHLADDLKPSAGLAWTAIEKLEAVVPGTEVYLADGDFAQEGMGVQTSPSGLVAVRMETAGDALAHRVGLAEELVCLSGVHRGGRARGDS